MDDLAWMGHSFSVMFIVAAVFIGIVFVLVIALLVSPRLRAKWMGRQIKATKYMIDEREEDLRHITDKTADIRASAVEKTVGAVKRGFQAGRKYCRYCGASIEEDSAFCSRCGNKQ